MYKWGHLFTLLPDGLKSALVKSATCKDGIIQEEHQETVNNNMNISKFGSVCLQATSNTHLQSYPTGIFSELPHQLLKRSLPVIHPSWWLYCVGDPWGCKDVTCRDKPGPGRAASCHNRGQLWARKPAPHRQELQQLVLCAGPPGMCTAPTFKLGALLFFLSFDAHDAWRPTLQSPALWHPASRQENLWEPENYITFSLTIKFMAMFSRVPFPQLGSGFHEELRIYLLTWKRGRFSEASQTDQLLS